MARTRFIDCIGASDEDIAHLRLLLRSSTIHLRDIWRWGPEGKADLVVVDVRSLIGDSAFRRTQTRGIACAQLIEEGSPAPEGRFLRKPLRREDFVALLNGLDSSVIVPMTILTQGDDFFDLDLGEPVDSDSAPTIDTSWERSEVERENESFETIFRRDPFAETPQFLIPGSLGESAGLEYIRESTARSAARADVINPFLKDVVSDAMIDPTYRRDFSANETDNETFTLGSYLGVGLLGGPARLSLPGVPALVLDPKEQVFHAEGKLPLLEAYVREPLRLGDWERLVNSEMDELRKRVPARPYLRLVWLESFLNSNGYLSNHLDPAGTYRLTRWLELAQDYPRAFRTGSNMIVHHRLDEIARLSEVSLAEVFDVVNAYDAIGYIEWAHRERVPRNES